MTPVKTSLFRLKKYIWHWLEEVDEHSLHSPFVFGFYKDIVKGKVPENIHFEGIEKLREIYFKDDRILQIHDLGAGSSVNSNSKRPVKDIAKHSLSSEKKSQFFYKIIEYFGAENVLEFGTSLGINTLYLASYYKTKNVVTVEGCANTASVAKATFQGLLQDKIKLINSSIDDSFSEISFIVSQLDFILIDANHTFDATMRYYQACKRYIHEDTILVLDDIYWSKEMFNAWEEIKRDIEVTLSIDMYEMGILFFKKNLQKEHYTLHW